jgi:hypothetical protein
MSRALLLVVVSLVFAVVGCSATRPEAATETVTMTITDRPVLELVGFIAAHYQRGLSVDHSVMKKFDRTVSIAFTNARWEQVRDTVANSCELDLSLSDDFLYVTHSSAAAETGRLVMRCYGIESLTQPLSNYEELPLDLASALAEVQVLPALSPVDPDVAPEISGFIELLQSQVRPESWQNQGIAIEEYHGSMVITQTPEIHAEVRAQLIKQEAMAHRQCVCRLYRLTAVPAGTGPVLSAAEWSTLSSATAPNFPPPAAVFLARNDQRQRHFAGVQRLLVLDADQNQNQHAPVTRLVSTGLSLSFQPTIMVDGVRMAARVWATVDATFPTQIIADGAGQPLMTITTPQIATDTADDLREIPFGGAAIYRFGERSYALTVEIVDLPGLKR